MNKASEPTKEPPLINQDNLSTQYHRWLRSIGKSERTTASYVGAIRGTISGWASDVGITQQNLITIQSHSTLTDVAEQLAKYDVFIEKNAKGKQMYSAALNSYKNFLAETCQTQVTEDIEQIISDPAISVTEKSMLVNTRIGQGKFREKLINYWHGCALTGYQSTQFLVASHIKPWRHADNNERLDPYNGLLLLPNLDKAFDLGYISFEESGKIRISSFIESVTTLGIQEEMKITLASQHQDYLAYHRDEVFDRKESGSTSIVPE